MREETATTIWITWGIAIMMSGVGFVLGGPYWGVAMIAAGGLLVLRGHIPQVFRAPFWTSWRQTALWLVACLGLIAIGLYAAALYVFPIPISIKMPLPPTLEALASPYQLASPHQQRPGVI